MTAYIANHEKKNRIFEKRERELRHAIKHGFPLDKLHERAELLRAAKISVFKCKFTKNCKKQPSSFSAAEMAARNKELAHWLAMSAEEIVEAYARGIDVEPSPSSDLLAQQLPAAIPRNPIVSSRICSALRTATKSTSLQSAPRAGNSLWSWVRQELYFW